MTISIGQFVEQNIILCVSTLIYEITRRGCLDEEIMIELWEGGIDYSAALYAIQEKGYTLEEEDEYWTFQHKHNLWDVDSAFEDEESAIEEFLETHLNQNINDYRHEVFEHWVVSNYLAARLRQKGETVVNLYGLTIWSRCTTGMSIAYDDVIQKVHEDAINHASIPDTFFD